MDELLVDFLSETTESLAQLDNDLIVLEKDPNNTDILNGIFRTLHTIKGTCGFLGFQRLELVAHAGESVLVKIRDNQIDASSEIISLIFQCLDAVKFIVTEMAEHGSEPEGDDNFLIAQLSIAAEGHKEDTKVELPEAPQEVPIATGQNENQPPDSAQDAGWDNFKHEPEKDATQHEQAPLDPPPSTSPVPAVPLAAPVEEKKPKAEKAEGESSLLNQNVRVNVKLLENLMNTVSDLVQTRNQLFQIFKNTDNPKAHTSLNHLSHITSELQTGLMKTRLQPISNAWAKIPRLVRDLAHDTGKQIELEMIGEETELDRQVIESIKDPLTHMIRNSADHGLESPEDRLRANKPEIGKITLKAFHAGGLVIVEIADNGRGLPIEKIKEKALKNGIVTQDVLQTMTESQVFQFIFSSGFSTAEKVTNISGRGVGMDVVRSNIEKIGGTVEVKSVAGKGSTFTIKIPLTVAIVSVLIAEIDGYRFAIQQLSILELVKLSNACESKVEYLYDKPVLRLRNKLIPLINLREFLGMKQELDLMVEGDFNKSHIIVLQVGVEVIGLIVDKVHDIQEIVVKPVPSLLKHIPIYAGNTILGDGSVIMILDPNGLVTSLGDKHNTESLNEAFAIEHTIHDVHQRDVFLVFYAGDETPKAIALSALTRLETIAMEKIEFSDNKAFIQYRGNLIPLINLSGSSDFPNEGIKPTFILSNAQHTMGVIIDEIVDILEEEMDVQMKSITPGKLGTIVLRNHATDIIDVEYYFQKVYPGEVNTSSKEQTKKNILYLGDNVYGISVLTPLLQAEGYHILKFDQINQARPYLVPSFNINTIILDLDSPPKDFIRTDLASLRNESPIPLMALLNQDQIEEQDNGQNPLDDIPFVSKSNRSQIIGKLNEIIKLQAHNSQGVAL